jgi:hypothetical protein
MSTACFERCAVGHRRECDCGYFPCFVAATEAAAKHRAGANADCPLSLWMIWVIQRLSSQRSHLPVGVAQLWIVRLIMRGAFFIVIAVCLSGCVTTQDPIDWLVSNLSATHGTWVNGVSIGISLPKTASTSEVIARVFEMPTFGAEKVTSYKILKIRQVRIPGSPPSDLYTAVLVQTNLGEKIVLLQYTGHILGWFQRVYDT